jgi:Flp pilus assembly protein TadG
VTGRWRSERGSQIAEFALVAPVLFMLIFSVPIFGIVMRSWFVVEAAAREGARRGAITGQPSDALQAACHAVTQIGRLRGVDGTRLLFACTGSFVEVSIDGTSSTVVVRYKQPIFIPGLGRILGSGDPNTITLVGRAVYLSEYGR